MDKRATITVHLQPGARRNQIIGFKAEILYVKVIPVAEKGKANQAFVALMADTVGLPASAITIVRGLTSRNKVVSIQGISEEDLRNILDREISCKDLSDAMHR